MAKEIKWSRASIEDRFSIYNFWLDHNKSETYSQQLEILFNNAAKLIAEYPAIGTQTDIPNLRVKVVRNYKLFYLNLEDTIQIVRVWDSRQNPNDLKL